MIMKGYSLMNRRKWIVDTMTYYYILINYYI